MLISHPLPRGRRFIYNYRGKPQKRGSGPINTGEIEQQELFWLKQAQQSALHPANFEEDKLQLNLQYNDQKVLECPGRIMGEYPMYLPDEYPFNAHLSLEGLDSARQGNARNTGYTIYYAW